MINQTFQTQIDLVFDEQSSDGELSENDIATLRCLDSIYENSDKVAIKKLSKNDRSWAWEIKESNQAGFYVPKEFRGTFFPSDEKLREAPVRLDKPHILNAAIRSHWPRLNVEPINKWFPSIYSRFTNKGTEGHFTNLPRPVFRHLSPASFLVMGRMRDSGGVYFECITIDSESIVYSMIEDRFDLKLVFLAGVFDPPLSNTVPNEIVDELDILISEFVLAAKNGKLQHLINRYSNIPDSKSITLLAQEKWLAVDCRRSFNPFELEHPGNVLRDLTTDIEFTIYRTHELRYRAAQALEIIFRDGVVPTTEQIVQRVVRYFIPLYQVMLNASQQRKNRVGAGFESHIKRMLMVGLIPYEEQLVVSTRRPDFVMPNSNLYVNRSSDALVLAAKTTLRERWKQVPMEMRNCQVFLATMDEKVTRSAVRDMNNLSITLVVPESFKAKGTVAEYSNEPNVQTFKEFFHDEIRGKRQPRWIELGAWPMPLQK